MDEFMASVVTDIKVSGVDPKDYPKFCDAFISSARWVETGEELTEHECAHLSDMCPDMVLELAHEMFLSMHQEEARDGE